MLPVLIVGVGNEFRADDAAGMLAVREAGNRLGERVRVLEATDDLTRIIDHIHADDQVIFIDAILSSDPPGTVRIFDLLNRSLPRDVRLVLSHAVTIPQVVDLAIAAGQKPRSAQLVGISVDCLGYGASVCTQVRLGIERAVGEIERLVAAT